MYTRETAMKWWNKLQYSEKWNIIATSSGILLGGVRSPDTLTGSEIEQLFIYVQSSWWRKKTNTKKGDNIQYVLNKGHATDELQPAIGLILRRKKTQSLLMNTIFLDHEEINIYHEEINGIIKN